MERRAERGELRLELRRHLLRAAGLAYGVGEVRNADRRTYAETRVYYPPGAEGIAHRLAAELGVRTAALPGGTDPLRLVVIAGAKRGG